MPAGFACIWCVSTLSSIKGGGGRDRKKREGRRGQGEKKERAQEEKLNQNEKPVLVVSKVKLI